jgi:3-methyladenine DNA glycosylase AlkD
MAWVQAAAAFGKKYLKDKLTKEAIKKGAGKALKHVGKQHLAKEQRKAVRREELGRGTDRKTLQRGGYDSPMDIENV